MGVNENDIDDLIGKVLSGEASQQESELVEDWRASSTANQKYFNDLRLIFEKASSQEIRADFDTDTAWKKVQSHIETEKVKTLQRNSGWALRLAAGIVLVIAAALIVYRYSTGTNDPFVMQSANLVKQDTLPDGSTAFLNKHSQLSYEYDRQAGTRKVVLKGEGFFDVVHEETKPFLIQAEETLIRDIGTSFNVKSVPEKDTIEVLVQSGEVQFYTLENPGVRLVAGETGLYSKSKKTFTKLELADTNALAYKTGILSFHGTDLQSVVDQINEVYESQITLSNPALANCRLTVTFRNDSLDTIVDIIAETLQLSVERVNEKEIILNGTGCR